VRCWGDDSVGQLGDGGGLATSVIVALGGDAIDVQSGRAHTCALLSGGTVVCWGDNTFHQVGVDGGAVFGPTRIVLPSAAAHLAIGHEETCVVLDTGAVWCWGTNWRGEIGDPAWPMGDGTDTTPIEAVAIARVLGSTGARLDELAVGYHQVCMRSAGAVWCWGENVTRQLGTGTTALSSSDPVRIEGLAL